MDLIDAVLYAVRNNQFSALEKALSNVLKDKHAQSLIFDYYSTEMHCLFSALLVNDKTMSVFKSLLKREPKYYSLFALERLNQMALIIEKKIFSVIQLLIGHSPDLLQSLIETQDPLRNGLTAQLLLKKYNIYLGKPDKTNLLTAFSKDEKASILKLLNPKLILTPSLIAQLFKIKKLHSSNDHCYLFNFASLFIDNPVLVSSWVKIEPRLLNYFTESHIDAEIPAKNVYKPFIHILAYTPQGQEIISILLDKNLSLFNNLSIEKLTDCKVLNSILYQLSDSQEAYIVLLKMINKLPQLFAYIRPDHLMERPRTAKNAKQKLSIIENLCLYDKDLTILSSFFENQDFMKAFKPELHLKSLIYALCGSEKAVALLSLILDNHPNMAEQFTKDVLFKIDSNLPQSTYIISLIYHNGKDGLKAALSIFKNKPSLLGLSKDQLAQLGFKELLNKIISIQLQQKRPNISKNAQEDLLWFQKTLQAIAQELEVEQVDELDAIVEVQSKSSFRL